MMMAVRIAMACAGAGLLSCFEHYPTPPGPMMVVMRIALVCAGAGVQVVLNVRTPHPSPAHPTHDDGNEDRAAFVSQVTAKR